MTLTVKGRHESLHSGPPRSLGSDLDDQRSCFDKKPRQHGYWLRLGMGSGLLLSVYQRFVVRLDALMRGRQDRDRDRYQRDRDRERDRTAWEEADKRDAETERRSEQLKEAWRQRHPEKGNEKDRP